MKVNRKTVAVGTMIRPDLLERAKADGDRAGYRTLRTYLEALIVQGLIVDDSVSNEEPLKPDEQTKALAAAYPSSAWGLAPTVIGHHVVRALAALAPRIAAGEDVGSLERDLTALRREITEHMVGLRRDYDREVEARDQRHYGRLGGME